jgi:large subunit ribosomal protein L6
MSKIGKMPIILNSGVTVTVEGSQVQISGTKGNASYTIPSGMSVEVAEGKVQVTTKDISDKKVRAMYGLTRANLANAIKGVDTGFEKKLELVGVGYRAQMQGNDLVLSLGFSHPVKFTPLDGVKIAVVDNGISISGADKTMVGELAARIRAVRPPEPYKGKGIKYKGEKIRRKAGKAAKAAGAK